MRFKPRKPKRPMFKPDPYVTNERIRAEEMRLIDENGKQIGVISRAAALQMATEEEKDLVMIAEAANPPVVKLIELSKHKYREQQKKQEDKKSAKVSEIKELRLTPFIAAGDLQSRIERVREFLTDGDKVRFSMKFRGREVTKAEFGERVFRQIFDAVSELGRVEIEPKLVGKNMTAQLTPLPKGKKVVQTTE